MNNMSLPLVSIVMATYNRADQLEPTITNIFEQDYNAMEVVIVNDGSTDNTLDILNMLQNTFDFKIIHNKNNQGLQKSLNIGIEQTSGQYIARIDDHDRWIEKDKLSKQVSFLESNPEVGIVGTAYKSGERKIQNPLTDSEIRNQILMRSPFCHVSVLIVRSILDKAGGYDESLPYSEDWDLWLKIGRIAQLANLPDIMVSIYQEELSLSGDYFLKQLPLNRKIIQKYYKDYPRSMRAYFYHHLLKFFFIIFPLNGIVHRLMKRIFLSSFALSSNRKSAQ